VGTGRCYEYAADVPSTVIESTRYDEASNTLDIVFTTGRVYRYFAVPAGVYHELESAPSKGQFFNAVIRPTYPCERLS
jgi:KTSC domain